MFSFMSMAEGQPDHSIWDRYVHKYVSSTGIVKYKSMKTRMDTLDSYLLELREHAPNSKWTKNERLAYYMNAYNAFTIKFVLTKYPVASVNDISFSGKDLWNFRMVQLGEKKYTLTQVENDILRKMNEPRIHFGINCASFSCPKLYNHAFTAEKVRSQLRKLTKAFINDPKRNVIAPKKIKISEIFKWYEEDFVTEEQTLIQFLNKYSDVTINANAKVEYLPYNWTLNE